jgi:hypothetical protein
LSCSSSRIPVSRLDYGQQPGAQQTAGVRPFRREPGCRGSGYAACTTCKQIAPTGGVHGFSNAPPDAADENMDVLEKPPPHGC